MEGFDQPVYDLRQTPLVIDWLLEHYSGGLTAEERSKLLGSIIYFWGAFEIKAEQMENLTVRQAFLLMREVLVEETRRTYADIAVQVKITAKDVELSTSRELAEAKWEMETDDIDDSLTEDELSRRTYQTAAKLQSGFAEHGLVQIG